MTPTPLHTAKRSLGVCLGSFVVFGLLAAKLTLIQAFGCARDANLCLVTRVLTPPRGSILDRHGSIFATSIIQHAIIVNPRQVVSPTLTADLVAAQLALPRRDVLARLHAELPPAQRAGYRVLKRDVSEDDLETIRRECQSARRQRGHANPWLGLDFEDYPRRQHPLGAVGAQLVGLSGVCNLKEVRERLPLSPELLKKNDRLELGQSGIEKAFDRYLAGEAGYLKAETDARGNRIPGGFEETVAPVPGNDLVLTLDEQIQREVEQVLARCREEFKARYVSAIVMKSRTGEILAMATAPGFDPARPPSGAAGDRAVNWAASAIYEPGSTFKVVVASAAIESLPNWNRLTAYCSGSKQFGNRTVKCWILGKKGHGHGSCDLRTGVRESCNMTMAEFGRHLGRERLLAYMEKFQIRNRPPTHPLQDGSVPGEARGVVPAPDHIADVTLAGMSFGQHFSTTPLAMLRAVNVIANDGTLVYPHVAKEVRSKEGEILKSFVPRMQTGIIKVKTARLVRDMMIDVVDAGTGKNARIPGLQVAGKTGTAQKAIGKGGYVRGKWVCSFVGFAPAANPELSIIVVANEPNQASGGMVCAPCFKEIAERTLARMHKLPTAVAQLKR